MSEPRRTAPSAAVPSGPAYVPQAALASERMLGSVLSRVVGPLHSPPRPVERAGQGTGQRTDAAAKKAAPEKRVLPQHVAAPAEEREAKPEEPSRRDEKAGVVVAREGAAAPRRVEPAELVPISASWAPPVARAGLAAESSVEEGRPLWSTLPKLDLAPVVAAVEAQLDRTGQGSRPGMVMTVLSGGPSDSGSGGEGSQISSRNAQRVAEESSAKLLEALRAHAAARATASDDRITLGDMTLIAHADGKQQLAAATQHMSASPGENPLARMIESPNHKLKPDQHQIDMKVELVMNMVRTDIKDSEKLAKERFGVS